ncbi:winged helix-turn-helix domain-containing protein [Pseudoteredinibacter isoporae]|uniref:winged helix-turn-helix domain-containing protein n=1 Tax=Pseudoteredinibacter isoporae TaxID=570281 RepID=UPI003103C843
MLIADWQFDLGRGELSKGDKAVKLEPLLCDFLQYLASRAGEIVTREELLEHVWQGRVVSDDSLRRAVKKLRLALGDDARNPRYIKTKPLQGYILVADVRRPILPSEKENNTPWRQIGLASLLALGMIAALAYPWLTQNNSDTTTTIAPLKETALTSLTGSEIEGNFHPELQRLLFTVRNHSNEDLHLYTKDLDSAFVQKISYGEGSYYRGLFSPSGTQIAYNLQSQNDEHTQIYIADYDPISGLSNAKPISVDSSTKSLSSWSSDGKALYFFNEIQHNEPWEIFRYRLDTHSFEQVTYSSKQGYGAFYAKESPDGRYLAILKNVVGRRYAMTLMDMSDNSLVAERNLNFFGDRVLWLSKESAVKNHDGSVADLAVSSFKGDLYYYSIDSDRLWEQNGTAPGLNDIFYDCGPRCFYMRRHTMNYTDTLEIANPFLPDTFQPRIQLESRKAEFHPIYSHDGRDLFYTQKDAHSAAIVRHPLDGMPEILWTFNPRHVTRELVLSPNQKFLAGRMEDRLFVLDLDSREFKYISSELEKVGPPSWSRDNQHIFFSRLKEDSSDLHAYQLANGQISYQSGNSSYYREQADGRSFVIDHELKLHQVNNKGERQFVHTFFHLSGSTWQVHNNTLYFTEPAHGSTYLVQLDLNTQQKQRQLLAKNSDSWEFHLHPDGSRLLMTRFQAADSDLVKVQWSEPAGTKVQP